MMPTSNYQLLDFGEGEKLEKFGPFTVRRPNLFARGRRTKRELWQNVDLTFSEKSQAWREEKGFTSQNWNVTFGGLQFGLKPTPVGHLGIFPEQELNWNWISEKFATKRYGSLKALNLFAYTGGTTMALANCGIQVVHLDGAANTVKWARANAAVSGLEQAPIRWIAEDTMRFIKREIKRGNRYDVLVADPPSFGRGPKKEQWRIQRDFPELFDLLPALMPEPKAVILSCHTEGFDCHWMAEELLACLGTRSGNLEKLQLTLSTEAGKKLESGDCVRWIAD